MKNLNPGSVCRRDACDPTIYLYQMESEEIKNNLDTYKIKEKEILMHDCT